MITSIASVGRCPKPDALVNQRERLLKKEPSGEAGLGGGSDAGRHRFGRLARGSSK